MNRYAPLITIAIILIIILSFGTMLFKTIEAGHVGVATLFGKVQEDTYSEGLHFPVNPLFKWHTYDARQKSHKETANVPSQDQLTTEIDVSVQYRINKDMAARILQGTGTAEDMLEVHLKPKLRSLLRELGKTIERAEDFFTEKTQQNLQANLTTGLKTYLEPKGITVEEVLIREIRLPSFITRAIETKKEREQEVEKQKAELERYRTEQQQKIAQAEAEKQAAEQEAAKRKLLADAQAYEIQKINESIAQNPAYIRIQALETLKQMSKDPAAKIYFINSDSPMPVPLMHMGENVQGIK